MARHKPYSCAQGKLSHIHFADQILPADPLKMTLKDIYRLQTPLLCWYQQNYRKLPWRETKNPCQIWVSEVMLQQTQVKTVVSYYQNFIRQFPTIETLAEADLPSVLKAWEGMGYYARARNLLKAANIIIKEHDGKIPKAYNDIHALPCVGNYIVAASSIIG